MAKLTELFVFREAPEPQDARPDFPKPSKRYDMSFHGDELAVIMSALFHHRDDPKVVATDRRMAKDIVDRIQEKGRWEGESVVREADDPELSGSEAGLEPGLQAKEDLYYNALGRFTFAAQRRDSAEDEDDRQHWRDRRRKLAKVLDRIARAVGLPTASELHQGD